MHQHKAYPSFVPNLKMQSPKVDPANCNLQHDTGANNTMAVCFSIYYFCHAL